MRSLVIIEDATIRSMLSDARYLAAFPCLQGQVEKWRKIAKPCCGGGDPAQKKRTQDEMANIIAAAMRCLIELEPLKKQQLKQLLRAQQIRVIALNPNGRRAKYTF